MDACPEDSLCPPFNDSAQSVHVMWRILLALCAAIDGLADTIPERPRTLASDQFLLWQGSSIGGLVGCRIHCALNFTPERFTDCNDSLSTCYMGRSCLDFNCDIFRPDWDYLSCSSEELHSSEFCLEPRDWCVAPFGNSYEIMLANGSFAPHSNNRAYVSSDLLRGNDGSSVTIRLDVSGRGHGPRSRSRSYRGPPDTYNVLGNIAEQKLFLSVGFANQTAKSSQFGWSLSRQLTASPSELPQLPQAVIGRVVGLLWSQTVAADAWELRRNNRSLFALHGTANPTVSLKWAADFAVVTIGGISPNLQHSILFCSTPRSNATLSEFASRLFGWKDVAFDRVVNDEDGQLIVRLLDPPELTTPQKAAIGGGVGGLIVLLLACALVALYWRQRRTQRRLKLLQAQISLRRTSRNTRSVDNDYVERAL